MNNCLASYMDRVRNLETNNQRLECKIWEQLENKGPFKTIKDLRAQIFANSVGNAQIFLQIDNAHLAAADFRLKNETELMYQSVKSDIHGFYKVINDTNVTQLQLETEIKAFKEELLFMKKNHKEDVKGLQTQIASSGLLWQIDSPKSQDLCKSMANMQAQYDKLTWKNQKELDKIKESNTVVTSQYAEVTAAQTMLTELKTVKSLAIELVSMRIKSRLENIMRKVETHYATKMEQLNGVLLHLESELSQTWAEGQCQAQEYEALLNIKVMLAEITTYSRLLEDREDFNLVDALDSSNSMQTIQKTITRRIVEGRVVSEMNNTEVLRH
uniref:IF rod domain-containing protein n=1 Tax=Otolemur garnettii TaxID=30611 RepID=H0XLC1_OTOGA